MEIEIDDGTMQIIKDMMKQENIYTLRISLAEYTWDSLIFEPVLDVQKDKDVEFEYKGIKIVATKQVETIVSKVKIGHENTSKGIKLKLAWEWVKKERAWCSFFFI